MIKNSLCYKLISISSYAVEFHLSEFCIEIPFKEGEMEGKKKKKSFYTTNLQRLKKKKKYFSTRFINLKPRHRV